MGKKRKEAESAVDEKYKLSILKLARALGRHAAREDYEREKQDWRKKPRSEF